MVRLPTASMITQRRDGTEANPPRFRTVSLIIARTDRPAGALRIGRSWLDVFRGFAGISRGGLIDRGILMRLRGNPVREGNRRLPAGPSAGLRCPLGFLSRQFFPGVQDRYFFDRSKKYLDIRAQEEYQCTHCPRENVYRGLQVSGVNLNPA